LPNFREFRNENSKFHEYVAMKVRDSLIDKQTFTEELKSLVRFHLYDEMKFFTEKLNILEQRIDQRSMSIGSSVETDEEDEEEELDDEVGDFLPEGDPLAVNRETEEGEVEKRYYFFW
jgi:hypothetical protein